MRLWDVATGRPLVVYRGAFGNLVFSEDDRLLAGACETSRCQLFEVAWPTGYRRLPPRLTHAQALDLDFTADWRLAAVAGSGHVRLVDVLAGDDLGLVGATLFRSVRFGPPDRTAVWAAGEGGFYRWRLRPSTHAGLTLLRPEPQERLLVQGTVAKFDFDLGEQRLAATALGRGIWLSALNHPAEAPRLFSRPAVVFVAMDPAGRWAASGTWKGKGVQVLDFSTGHLLASLPIPGSANVAASPNGEWLATSNEAETRLWTTATWSVAPQALAGDPTFQAGIMAFSPDSRLLAVCHDSSEIRLVRVPGLEPVARFFLPCEGNIVTLRFSPDGQTLAALETTGDIHLWDLRVVRSELRNLGLDWNYPAFEGPASPAAAAPTAIALDVGPFGRDELARRIPPRNPNTPPHLPDLSAYYNAPLTANWQGDHKGRDDLAKWPCGITNLGGVAFDVRGLIQIGTAGPGGTSYPDRVEAVSVGQVAARLHFLHAAVDAAAARSGDTLGHYVIRYVDGRRADIPIVFGKDLADWRSPPGDAALTATPAWTGAYPAAAGSSRNVSLFKTSWDNPHPGVPIRQLDFIAEKGAMGAPFLVALTLDPPTATGAGGPQPAGP
jgi:WD40 repeat protein